jgi:hypothetical protein
MLLVCRAYVFALNSSLDVSQYAHTSWKTSEGFSEGLIQAAGTSALAIDEHRAEAACLPRLP